MLNLVLENYMQFIGKTGDSYGNMSSLTQDDAVLVSLCSFLGNKVSCGIIKSTIKSPRSAVEISKENRVPLSSVYRQIRRLQESGIIHVESKVSNNKNNKRIAYYRLSLRLARMSIDEHGARVHVKSGSQ
jgi:DNA-binding transcriptional ArsR family regulator